MRKISLVIVGAMMLALGAGACGSNVKENAVETKPLEKYEIYHTYNDQFKERGNELVSEFMAEGMSEEEACKEAIHIVCDELYEYQMAFVEKYSYDLNDNGILDAVERGEITQEYATEMGYPEETEEEKAAREKRKAEQEVFRAELFGSFGYVTEKDEDEAIREMIERNIAE